MSSRRRILHSLALTTAFMLSAVLSALPNAAGVSHWTAHAPIIIDGDGDLIAANGVTRGSGTGTDPYVIELWSIMTSNVPGIDIRNTSAHILITDMYIWNILDATNGAIRISNASNIEIETSYIGTSSTEIGGPYGPVLYLDNASYVAFRDPELLNGGGIRAVDSDNLTVQGCQFMAMSDEAIYLERCDNVTVSSNRIDVEDKHEFWVTDSSNVLITNNDLGTNGLGYGFHVYSSVNVTVHHNNILCFSPIYDDHTIDTDCPDELFMDASYPDGGNYWELYAGVDLHSGVNQNQPNPDGIVDSPFTIGGDTDNYPLMEPVVWYTPTIMWVAANLESQTLKVGQKINMTGTATDHFGHVMFDLDYTWSLDRDIASIEVNETNSSRAELTAEMEGLVWLTLISGTDFGMHLLEISLGLTSMSIAPANPVIEFGNTTHLSTSGANEYASFSGFVASWTARKGYIDGDGVYTANSFDYTHISSDGSVDPCTYAITAEKDGFTASTTVTVVLYNTTDHDGDGILDWREIINGLDPFNASDLVDDLDNDGMTNAQEVAAGTKPYTGDTDGDGLWDTFEIIFSKTSPTMRDSDGDGTEDKVEFDKAGKYTADITLLPDGWTNLNISWKEFTMYVDTNSTVVAADFDASDESLVMMLSGATGSDGVLDIKVPRSACDKEDIVVKLDGAVVEQVPGQDADYYYLHIEYTHSSHEITLDFGKDDGSILGSVWLYLGIAAAAAIAAALVLVMRKRKTAS